MATRQELHADVRVTGTANAKRELDSLGNSADRTGDKFEGMGKDAGFLTKQLAEAEQQYKQLRSELLKSGTDDPAILKEFRRSRRQVRFFEGLKKELEKELEEAATDLTSGDGGSGAVGRALMAGVGKAAGAAMPALIGGLVVVAAELLPFLGAAVAGTVLGAAGAGGIVGGFVLAVHDPRVKDAAKELGQEAKAAFGDLGDDFAAPAIEALHVFQAASRDVAGEVDDALDPLKQLMPVLARGLTGFVEELLPGLGQGLKEGMPAIRALSTELPKIGHAVGDLFDIMGDESDGATMGFTELSHVLQAVIHGTAEVLAQLSAMYEWSVRTGTSVTGVMADMFGWVPIIGDQFETVHAHGQALQEQLGAAKDKSHDFTGGLEEMGSIAKDAAEQIDAMQTALDKLFGNTMDLDRATIAYEKSVDDLVETLSQNKRTLDANTEAGRENRGEILDQIAAIKNMHDANVANNMAMDEADAVYQRQLESLRQTAYRLGYNKQQVDELVNAYKGLPSKAEVEVSAPGLLAAIARVRELARLLGSNAAAANGDPSRASINNPSTYVSGRAGGGPVMAGRTYVVGENGPEVLQMSGSGGYVYSGSGSGGPAAAAMMSGASGGSRPQVNIYPPPPSGNALVDALMAVLWPQIIERIRVDGGDLSAVGAA